MTVMQYSQVAPDHQFVLVVHLILEPQEHQGYPKIWYWEDKKFMRKT